MNEDVHDIEDLFHSNLEDQEEVPPEEVWEAIEGKLNATTAVIVDGRYNRRSLLAMIVLTGFLVTFVYQFQTTRVAAIKPPVLTGKEMIRVPATLPGKKSFFDKNSPDATVAVVPLEKDTFSADLPAYHMTGDKPKAPATSEGHRSLYLSYHDIKVKSCFREWLVTPLSSAGSEYSHAVAAPESNRKISGIKTAAYQDLAAGLSDVHPQHIHPARFSIMPFVSVQMNVNRILDDDDSRITGPRSSQRHEIESGENQKLSLSVGLLADIPVWKKWSLLYGISYVRKSIEIDPRQIYAEPDEDGMVKYRLDFSSGYSFFPAKPGSLVQTGDSISAGSSTNTLRYVGIPLALQYTFSNRKFDILPSVGAQINFLTGKRIETVLTNGAVKDRQNIKNIDGLKKMYFNTITSLAIQYTLKPGIAFDIIPSASFAIGTINKNAAVRSYPNVFGVAAGMKCSF